MSVLMSGSRWFKLGRGSQEKRPFSNGLFSIQSEGLACNLTAGEYVIAEGVWHHASACISPSDWLHTSLRDDSIQGFALIPYRRQAADFIHGFAVNLLVAFLFCFLCSIYGNTPSPSEARKRGNLLGQVPSERSERSLGSSPARGAKKRGLS